MASLKMVLSAGMLSFILISCLVVVEAGDKPKKLQIGVKKKVENCDRRSKAGDSLHMHYTVRKKQNHHLDLNLWMNYPT